MKVLWFSNTPSLAQKKLKNVTTGGGWIESLEKNIKKDKNIQLAVAYHWGNKSPKKISYNDTTYYTFPAKSTRIKNLVNNVFFRIEPLSNINYYLEVIKDFKPDIIQIFGTERDFGLIISKINIPVVIHIQGNLTACLFEYFSGFSKKDLFLSSNIYKYLTGNSFFHSFIKMKKMAKRERAIFKSCNYFMGRTDWDRRLTYLFSKTSQYFHCDELLRDNFYNESWSKKRTKKFILTSTMFGSVYKGIETIVDSIALLNNYTNIDFEWRIAGISPNNNLIKILKKSARRCESFKKINFLGELTPNYLIEELKKSDIFVHPSHIDNSPNSVCEAMIIGMPIISSCTGGIPSLINNKEEGILIKDGDPYSLAGSIIELFKDENYACFLGKNARKRALIRHNPNKITKTINEIYLKIIGDFSKIN
ncbi:MAG: glycosyltransferase [Bacteroidetes bacterium]|nr:glycosyltransferase [Bacteroidota bacterium]